MILGREKAQRWRMTSSSDFAVTWLHVLCKIKLCFLNKKLSSRWQTARRICANAMARLTS